MKNFNKRLKILRNERKSTQEEVAKYLNVQRATYSGYERGVIMPPYEKIDALAHYFNVSVEFLMGERAPEKPSADALEILLHLINELLREDSAVTFDGVTLSPRLREILKSNLGVVVKTVDLVLKEGERGGENQRQRSKQE